MTQKINAQDFVAQTTAPEHVVDVRTHAEVRSQYLAGAHHLPLQDLSADALLALVNEKIDNDTVYLLCKSGQRAQLALDKLPAAEQTKFVVIEGGIDALSQAGAIITQGSSEVMSLERQVRIAAGAFVFISCMLGFFVDTGFFGIATFVGAGLMFAGITNTCAMGMVIAKMPWNR